MALDQRIDSFARHRLACKYKQTYKHRAGNNTGDYKLDCPDSKQRETRLCHIYELAILPQGCCIKCQCSESRPFANFAF